MKEELESQLSNAFKFKFSFSQVIEISHVKLFQVLKSTIRYLFLKIYHKTHHQPVLGVNADNMLIT